MDMNKDITYIEFQFDIATIKLRWNYALQVVMAHTVGKTQTFAIYTIIRDGSQRGNVCNNAHSCRLQSVCDVRHYHIRWGKTKCVWLSTYRTRFIITNCLWCARHRKCRASLVRAWKTPVPRICLVLGKTTKLRLRWQCEHKWVARMKHLGYSRYQKWLYRDNCMHQGSLSPTVSGSCGNDPPIAHTHLATVPNAVAERG